MTAAHVVNDGGRKLRARRSGAARAGDRRTAARSRDPAGLATALNEFFSVNELPRRGIRLGLANSRIGVRVIEVTGVDDTPQLENAIGFRAHEILSVPARRGRRSTTTSSRPSTGEDGQVTTYRILLVVAYRDSVDRYLAATDAAEHRGGRHRPRRLRPPARAAARPEAVAEERDLHAPIVGGLDRPRPDDPRDLRRLDLPVHPRARVGHRRTSTSRSAARSR